MFDMSTTFDQSRRETSAEVTAIPGSGQSEVVLTTHEIWRRRVAYGIGAWGVSCGVLYGGERAFGPGGASPLFKLRTMQRDHPDHNAIEERRRAGRAVMKNDAEDHRLSMWGRVPIGRLLRSPPFRINEWPQVLNMAAGDLKLRAAGRPTTLLALERDERLLEALAQRGMDHQSFVELYHQLPKSVLPAKGVGSLLNTVEDWGCWIDGFCRYSRERAERQQRVRLGALSIIAAQSHQLVLAN